jgi:hypothetical protein
MNFRSTPSILGRIRLSPNYPAGMGAKPRSTTMAIAMAAAAVSLLFLASITPTLGSGSGDFPTGIIRTENALGRA